MQDDRKAVWSIPYVSVVFFPSLKRNFIAYRSSKVFPRPDCIFEIHQMWQSGVSRVYSKYCCSCSFEAEIIKIGQSSHKMYSINIVNFQEFRIIVNAWTKKSKKTYWWHLVYIYIYIYICAHTCILAYIRTYMPAHAHTRSLVCVCIIHLVNLCRRLRCLIPNMTLNIILWCKFSLETFTNEYNHGTQ